MSGSTEFLLTDCSTLANLTRKPFISELVKIIQKFKFLVKEEGIVKFFKALKVASNIPMNVVYQILEFVTKLISPICLKSGRG